MWREGVLQGDHKESPAGEIRGNEGCGESDAVCLWCDRGEV